MKYKNWKFYIEIWNDETKSSDIIENKPTNNGIPVCNDYNVCINFDSIEEVENFAINECGLKIGEFWLTGFYE